MNRTTLFTIVCLAAATAGAVEQVIPQRRNDVERRHGVVNEPGETTYAVDADARRAVLTVGTTEAGDMVVGDPYAIHFAPTRQLLPDEWAVSFGEDVYYGPNGEILFATPENAAGWSESDPPRTATILPAHPDIAFSGISFASGGGSIGKSVSDDRIVLSARKTVDPPFPGAAPAQKTIWASNLVVHAFAGPTRSETFDATLCRVTLKDNVGSVPLSDLRDWVLRTYEDRAAEDWSRYPAVSTVNLAGNHLAFNSAGNLYLGMESDNATNAIRFVANFSPVLSIVPGVVTNSTALTIWRFAIEDGEAALYVSADLGVPVGIQTTADLRDPFVLAAGATSSYPATTDVTDPAGVSHACYRVSLPVDENAGAAFYRACAEYAATGGNQLRIENCDLWIDGVKFARETWTFALTNGTTVTRTVLVGEEAQ